MYWISEVKKINNKEYYIYSYYTIEERTGLNYHYYNSETKQITYPPKYDFVVKSYMATSEDDFLQYAKTARKL